jgi:hypothetical protein
VLMQTQTQMPFYTDCFLKPNIIAGDIVANGTCSPLHHPQTNNLLFPTPEFRKVESVTLDASRCQFYLNQNDASRAVQGFLEPMNIQMRANSTDHDVFLQVLPTSRQNDSVTSSIANTEFCMWELFAGTFSWFTQ